VTYSLLVTQLGYGPGDPKRFVVRAAADVVADPVVRCLRTAGGEHPVRLGERVELWGMSLWPGWLGELPAGRYVLEADGSGRSQEFAIEEGVLADRTLEPTIAALEARIGGKLGWQDCAFDGRGLESHAIVVLGLVDALALMPRIPEALRSRMRTQLRHGADYLRACQRPDGSFMNEYYIGRDLTVWTLVGLATSALARTAGLLSSGADLDAAKRGWDWMRANAEHGDDTLDELESTRRIFGQYAPWTPPSAPRARDVLLQLRVATDLYRHTNDLTYGEAARDLARTLRRDYQVLGAGGYRGHFRAWPGEQVRQPGWEHAGWGYDCGAVLPDDVSGIVDLLELFPDSPDAPLWRATLWDYAAGYLIPATAGTPFGIYPVTESEGRLRYFGPAWHGFNGMYGQVARIAALLARVFAEPRLERIAHDNLQWIAGVNVGAETAAGVFRGLSWFHEIGETSADAWSGIPGSIGNGFSASAQFALEHLDDLEDAPRHPTNEDWLVHTGSWLSGLAHVSAPAGLKVRVTRGGAGERAEIRVACGELTQVLSTDARGIALLSGLPPMAGGTVTAGEVSAPFASVSGARAFVELELDDAPAIRVDPPGVVVVVNPGADALTGEILVATADGIDRAAGEIPAGSTLELGAVPAGEWYRIVVRGPRRELVLEPPMPGAPAGT